MRTLITGASSGIGEALAIACAERGDELFLCGRNEARLKAVAERCGGANYRVVDVADAVAMRAWMRETAKGGELDLVFANAGVSTGEETEENVRNTFAINVGGCVNTVLPAIELKVRQIVLTASIAGYGPLKACPSYSATKACVKNWGLSLRGHLAAQGIKVNVICPGFVRSRITDKNKCAMPFFWEADKAARVILKRVEKDVPLIAFPWPMRLATWFLSCLPFRLNDLINKFLPKKA